MGEGWAFLIGRGHELYYDIYEQSKLDEPITWDEGLMDLHNNAVGRKAGANGVPIYDNGLRIIDKRIGICRNVGGDMCVY